MKNVFFLLVIQKPELIINNMLTNVTKKIKIEQLLRFTCFYIHVGSDCVGGNTYA